MQRMGLLRLAGFSAWMGVFLCGMLGHWVANAGAHDMVKHLAHADGEMVTSVAKDTDAKEELFQAFKVFGRDGSGCTSAVELSHVMPYWARS